MILCYVCGRSLEIGAGGRWLESLVRTSASRADDPGSNPGGRTKFPMTSQLLEPVSGFGPARRPITSIRAFSDTLLRFRSISLAVSTICRSRYRHVDFLLPFCHMLPHDIMRLPIFIDSKAYTCNKFLRRPYNVSIIGVKSCPK